MALPHSILPQAQPFSWAAYRLSFFFTLHQPPKSARKVALAVNAQACDGACPCSQGHAKDPAPAQTGQRLGRLLKRLETPIGAGARYSSAPWRATLSLTFAAGVCRQIHACQHQWLYRLLPPRSRSPALLSLRVRRSSAQSGRICRTAPPQICYDRIPP